MECLPGEGSSRVMRKLRSVLGAILNVLRRSLSWKILKVVQVSTRWSLIISLAVNTSRPQVFKLLILVSSEVNPSTPRLLDAVRSRAAWTLDTALAWTLWPDPEESSFQTTV